MALRLRRGTDAERLTITPAEGEPIFTTDTKQLYIGDGVTAGGIVVDTVGGSGALTLSQLTDVDLVSVPPVTNNVLKFDGVDWVPSADLTGAGGSSTLADLTDTNFTVTPIVDDILKFDGANWIASSEPTLADLPDTNFTVPPVSDDVLTFNGANWIAQPISSLDASTLFGTGTIALRGNVIASDTTIIVDGDNKSFTGDLIGNVNGSSVISNSIKAEATAGLDVPLRAYGYYDGTDGHVVAISRARGTAGTPTNLLAGDAVGSLAWFDIGAGASAAQIVGRIDPDSTPSATVAPGRLEFITSSNAGTPIVRAYIDYAGTFVTNGIHNGRTFAPTGIPFYSLSASNVTSDGPRFLMRRARGTFDTPLTVIDGDAIHRITFGAHDGSGYVDSAYITARVDGTVSTGVMPTSIDVKTTTPAGTSSTNASFRADGHTEFSGAVKLAVYADDTARDAAVTAPEAGMMIFNTTLTKFQGYTGSAWVDLN
jgi:hypothetical protein